MAAYNEILTGRHNRFIQKLFQMKGEPPAPQLSTEVQMVHPYFHGAENRYLESWERFGNGLSLGPVAAQNQGIRIRNPVGSNVMVVIERALVSTSTAQEIDAFLQQASADLATGTQAASQLDGRTRPVPSAIVSFQTTTVAGTSNPIFKEALGVNAPVDLILTDNQEITLTPGSELTIVSNTVNTSLAVSFTWRERFLEEAERA